MTKLKVGNIVRYTRFQSRDLSDPMWAEVTRVGGSCYAWGRVLIGGSLRSGPDYTFGMSAENISRAHAREVFSKDNAPDDYYAAIAKQRLMESMSDCS